MPRRTFLFNRTDKRKYRLNGVKRSTRLPQNACLQKNFSDHRVFSNFQLPPKVDLRMRMTPVEDQKDISSCVANACAGAHEYLMKCATGQNIDVSRLFIYYNARVKDEGSDEDLEDDGCTITSAIESLQESGTCLESIWPYYIKRMNTCPSNEAYQGAQYNKINDALQLNIDLYEMKSCLAQGYPFVFGLVLYKSFDKAETKGVVPMPKPSDKGRDSHGSHAMLAVGYSDTSRAFIVRNSWGVDWGDQGYCYIPYDYMADPDYLFDPWVVRRLGTNDLGHDHWDDDDSVDYQDDDDEDEEDEDDYDIEDEDVDEDYDDDY